MLKVIAVERDGVAAELGICIGAEIVAFDGFPAQDVLDYLFYNQAESFVMTVREKGILTEYEVEKNAYEDLGLTFADEELEPKRCRNNCVFCFVDQMPKGLRDTLYVKDDDYRLSFASGNFVTLTNLSDEDIDRIIRLGLAPLYISVHTLNAALRCKMLNNRFAGNLWERMQKLAAADVEMYCQIVLCPNYNDQEEMTETLTKLRSLYPAVRDVAVVPVGMTKYREGLTPLKAVDKACALEVINRVERLNALHPLANNLPFARCSDEFYVKAEVEVPTVESYGQFEQIENGVGMIARFQAEFCEEIEALSKGRCNRNIAVITGVSAARVIQSAANALTARFEGLKIDVRVIVNHFFGESVTVTGLITAGDVIEQVSGNYDYIMLPQCMLREFEDVFLDGISLRELEEKLHTPVLVTDGSGNGFVRGAVLAEGRRVEE